MRSLIEAGNIKKNKGSSLQEEVGYEMRFMDNRSIPDLLDLQDIIIQNLSDKEIFRTHTIDYFIDHLRFEKAVIGTFTDDGLIAYSIIHFPGEKGDNFGRDINLPAEDLEKVAHLAKVAVHPAYRGNSLQSKMQSAHLKVIKEKGFEHVCCMVSQKNSNSLQNIFSLGLTIRALKVKFGFRLRYIMHKSLSSSTVIGSEEVRIRSCDIKGQIALLDRGFLGFGLTKNPEGMEISYGKVAALTT